MPIVTLDTKLLVLLTVGLTSRRYISAHKRLTPYTDKDFDLLFEILTAAENVVVSPNTVTEASNFLVTAHPVAVRGEAGRRLRMVDFVGVGRLGHRFCLTRGYSRDST